MIFFSTFLLFTMVFFGDSRPLLGDPFIEGFVLQNKDIFPFQGPTERHLEHETPRKIESKLIQQRIPADTHWYFWMAIAHQEERGVFGYSAAKQQFRIFQDIVKMIFAEILEIEVDDDFHFFRVPLDPLINDHEDARSFLNHFSYIDDVRPEQRNQLISINYSLFGNYYNTASAQCTVCYFSQNSSYSTVNYEKKLTFLFEELGIPTSQISELFRTGSSIERSPSGVLYQFFDTSHFEPHTRNGYELTDELCYPAKAGDVVGGTYDHNVTRPFSEIFQETYPRRFDTSYSQIRLIMNNQVSLNPFSPLRVRRYDQIDAETTRKYEKALRKKIQQLPRNHNKVNHYKEKLRGYWNVGQ